MASAIELLLLAQASVEPVWVPITLGTNFTYTDTQYGRPAYQVSADGRTVSLRGVVRNTTAPLSGGSTSTSQIGSVGASAAPPDRVMLSSIQGPSSGTAAGTPVRIDVIGTAIYLETTVSVASYFPLDGLFYTLEPTV